MKDIADELRRVIPLADSYHRPLHERSLAEIERLRKIPIRYSLIAEWDDEARVWCAHSDDIDGLVIEATTIEELFRKAAVIAPELMRLNGQPCP